MQIMVDGLLTAYERRGTGWSLIMLHGWGDRASGLRSLGNVLSHDFDVIAVDLPGFGGTQVPPLSWGLDDYAQFVAHFLGKLDVTAYALLGHSNGGAIIIRGLSSGTLEAERLILLASAGIRGEYSGRNRLVRYAAKAGKALAAPLPQRTKQALRRQAYATIGSDALVAEHLLPTFKKIVTDDVRDDAAKITIPTLLIYGDQDTATPTRYGQMLHERIKGSKLEAIPGAGHFVHLDNLPVVAEQIREFLQ